MDIVDLWNLISKMIYIIEDTVMIWVQLHITHNKQYLVFLFIQRVGYKYEELCVYLENDWHKWSDNFLHTVNEAYTLLKTFRSSKKYISNIVKKNRQNYRRDNITN